MWRLPATWFCATCSDTGAFRSTENWFPPAQPHFRFHISAWGQKARVDGFVKPLQVDETWSIPILKAQPCLTKSGTRVVAGNQVCC
ncbi:hypothetical protein PF005_g9273 [Phytophthora fragariae]|uniref:Uncharacterized protein n=1 Tax=Phytophthora fragariae TaxID=53985 RepID=A0A6A4A238_9STRA|nr:hypothetical protein PF003_g31222 [Phytophthora fragariae]KAE8939823.1 hypothetical protein PF009_g10349 [Phytophthora fragariae]KAE9117204.1 hypothetical protein PF007_g9368 [Phytophthora fragariae]KAE9146635.1 hypothetical protein PF006_g8612 [Phytophthora fragariae]KAE9215873.1 hypothetical protein PF005_g9273 [Phytophthora fragariae]